MEIYRLGTTLEDIMPKRSGYTVVNGTKERLVADVRDAVGAAVETAGVVSDLRKMGVQDVEVDLDSR